MKLDDIIKAAQDEARRKLKPEVTNIDPELDEARDFVEKVLFHFWDLQKIDLDEVIASTAHSVAEAVRAETLAWAKSNARTKDTNMSALQEDWDWEVDYRELEEFLSPTQEK